MSVKSRLDGKRALVTAAGQGIGRASALAMAEEGARVFASDVNEKALEELSDLGHPNIEVFRLDACNEDDVRQGVARADPDILFNCAGYVHTDTVLDCSDEDWDFAFDINVRSMFRTIRAALPAMVEREYGSIINMSSAASSIIGAPNRFIYGTTKAAVIGMTKSVARDFITKGVRCNAICPGTIDSPSMHDRMRATGDYEKAKKDFIARQPMERMGTAEEVAALVVYLASAESAFTTGQACVIDGGWSG